MTERVRRGFTREALFERPPREAGVPFMSVTGSDFMGNWNDLTVGDLFERIRVSMPPSGPGAVTPAQKADIVAHILNSNKFPAGTAEMEPKTEVLKGIKIEMKK